MQRLGILQEKSILKNNSVGVDYGVRGGRYRLVCQVVDCTVNGLIGHVEGAGFNPSGIQEPTEVLKPRSS